MKLLNYAAVLIALAVSTSCQAELLATMKDTSNDKIVGTITIQPSKYGTLFAPNLTGLKPGSYGFHVHENPSCDDHGNAAGGHLDPQQTHKHSGPYDDTGHLGDLPLLTVNSNGEANTPVLAPRIKLTQLSNRSLMIHANSDNYSDQPAPLGGGGSRMICGVISDSTAANVKK